jgi:deoxyribodipyrimidine photo-lyase
LTVAEEMSVPLLVVEPLRAGYRWANARHHAFVLDGMRDNRQAFEKSGVTYFPYVEPAPGDGSGLLAALAAHAAVVVTDDFPAFFLPKMVQTAAARLPVRLEAVDSNGLIPMRLADKTFSTAFQFRRFVHATLPELFDDRPHPVPLSRAARGAPDAARIPDEVAKRWPSADLDALAGWPGTGAGPSVDLSVRPVAIPGGVRAARRALDRFLDVRLRQYAESRNVPDLEVTSELSPYLHFGHIAVHEVVDAVLDVEEWTPDRIVPGARGRRAGWWGLTESAESFLDELVTWREVGFNMCVWQPRYDHFETLPEWARRTLAEHAGDPRQHLYSLEEFESAETHDPLWNAAQRQLAGEGKIHNYLRMLWGKKILEWSASPEEALDIMIELNNTYALDGRDPNSYSGIFWVLGRYDRPWGPERPVFGKVRYMSSENTARKVSTKKYLDRFATFSDAV